MKEFLIIDNIGFAYPNSESLFENVSFQCQAGWTGMVGPNGGGKSTLLKLVHGDLLPDYGTILTPGFVHYADQRMDQKPDDLRQFIYDFDKQSIRIKNRLRIQEEWLERWGRLSFGERKRCQVGLALAKDPAVLLLDEPSNHLDHYSKNILLDTLQNFKGIGLLVSHDRELLDELCSHTIFVDSPHVDKRACPYSLAIQERKREQASLQHERETIKREVKKLKRRVQQQRKKAENADKQRSKRGLDRKDHDAKEKIDAARLSGKDGLQGRLYKRAQNQLERAEQKQGVIRTKKEYKLGISFDDVSKSHKFPLTISAGSLKMGETTLHIPDLSLMADEKIGIVGDNGAGKSTFVKFLVNYLPLPDEKLIYIPQEIAMDEAAQTVKRVQGKSDRDKGDIMTIIRRLGSEPARLLETRTPSPGELRKLMLAEGIQRSPALIIMDEPTNHMDLPSIQCVEDALRKCACSLLLVSHDYLFLRRIVTYFWVFERTDSTSRIVPRQTLR